MSSSEASAAVEDCLARAAADGARGFLGAAVEGMLPSADEDYAAPPSAEALAARLAQTRRDRPVAVGTRAVRVTASFGVAVARPGESWDALFSRVDQALYRAKADGRDRVASA
jgi:GGDEF domain-containing protein